METKKKFTVTIDGTEKTFSVIRPTQKILTKAGLVKARAFKEAVEAGMYVQAKLTSVLREQKLWDDEREKRYKTVLERLNEGEKTLCKKGGVKLTEARKIALQMIQDRNEIRSLLADRNELNQNTAETHSENTWFNYLVSACTLDQTNKPYFRDFEDYQSRENDPVIGEAARLLGQMIYQIDDNYQAKLPEYRFLKRFKFVDEKLRLTDPKTGYFVDEEGRRVDEKGRLINEDGRLVDFEGNEITEEGDYVGDPVFFTDEGEPIEGPTEETPSPELAEVLA